MMKSQTYVNAFKRGIAVLALKLDRMENANLPEIEPGDWILIQTIKPAGSVRRLVARFEVTAGDVGQLQ